MAKPRLGHHVTFWAPRALVVISCALALLAVQPTNSLSVSRSRPVVLKETSGGGHSANWEMARRTPAAAARPVARASSRTDTLFASTQRLHILATVDILQRLLLAELQPVQHHFLATLWLLPECPAITTIKPAPAATMGSRNSLFDPLPEVEKAFAMAHCLLAPPLA
jgi:hypothetical protein